MTDHPMNFSAPMVRALIEGRKTQTRRAMTPSNTLFNGEAWGAVAKRQTWDWAGAWVDAGPSPVGNPGPYLKLPWLAGDADIYGDTVHRIYPRTQPGDRIWVKETWHPDPGPPTYRADVSGKAEGWGWRASRFMPRRLSRLTLTVTEVRLLRLWDIDEDDARAEGTERMVMDDDGLFYLDPERGAFRCGFAGLWDSLNAKRGRGWDANDWVAALTFTVERRNIDEGGQG